MVESILVVESRPIRFQFKFTMNGKSSRLVLVLVLEFVVHM